MSMLEFNALGWPLISMDGNGFLGSSTIDTKGKGLFFYYVKKTKINKFLDKLMLEIMRRMLLVKD